MFSAPSVGSRNYECKPLAEHLNGTAGVIRGADPANSHRVIFRSVDGNEISVKPQNCLIL